METLQLDYPPAEATLLLKKACHGCAEAKNKITANISHQMKANVGLVDSGNCMYCRTNLIHIAYFKTIDIDRVEWEERAYFFAVASKGMRMLLTKCALHNYARQEQNILDTLMPHTQQKDLAGLDTALSKLSTLNNQLVSIVECRYFGGMSTEEIALALNITRQKATLGWIKARGWLYKEINMSYALEDS